MKAETVKDLGDYFKKLAEKHDKEDGEVKLIFQKQYEKCIKSPSMVGKTEAKRVKRTKSMMTNYFRNLKRTGKAFVFIPFGHISKSKDWNEKALKKIGVLAKSGRIAELITQDKILTMVKGGVKVPISKVIEWGKRKVYIKAGKIFLTEVDDSIEATQSFVVEGTPLLSGKNNVIPKDNRIYLSPKSDKINFKWTRELEHNFSAQVWGWGYPKDDQDNVRMCHFSLRGEQANPYSNDFFFKKYPAFRPYEADLSVFEKEGVWELNYKGQLNPKNGDIPGVDDNNIDDVIEANLTDIRELYIREGIKTFVPPVIYIDGISDFHESTCILEGGKVKKSAKGYDFTEWGRYAILLADIDRWTASVDPKKSNFYLFSDGDSDKRSSAFGDHSQFNASPIIAGTPIISLINTSRGSTRYDFKTKNRVPDPENGDINLNVNTIRQLPRVEMELDDDEDYEEDE